MLPAQLLPGCHFAQVYQRINEPQKVDYVEEWDDLAGLRPQLSCERFSRLLELVEMAAEAPEVEFRWISETHGMDYIATQRAVQAGGDVEPEARVVSGAIGSRPAQATFREDRNGDSSE